MNREFTPVFSMLLLSAEPAWASSFKVYEESLGSPGVTATFPTGTGLIADIDSNASTAEGGSLSFGASEITIVPFGGASLTAFTCDAVGAVHRNFWRMRRSRRETRAPAARSW